MRITEAARRLGMSPRMLRYRETLGLLPAVRPRPATAAAGWPHRRFGPADLEAVALGLEIERRYDISPAALAFGVRVLAEPAARADVTRLAARLGRIRPLPVLAVDFEKARAARLLSAPPARRRDPRPGS